MLRQDYRTKPSIEAYIYVQAHALRWDESFHHATIFLEFTPYLTADFICTYTYYLIHVHNRVMPLSLNLFSRKNV